MSINSHLLESTVVAADWAVADMLALRQGSLGNLRYMLKEELKWLPLYGWYFAQVRQILFCSAHE